MLPSDSETLAGTTMIECWLNGTCETALDADRSCPAQDVVNRYRLRRIERQTPAIFNFAQRESMDPDREGDEKARKRMLLIDISRG